MGLVSHPGHRVEHVVLALTPFECPWPAPGVLSLPAQSPSILRPPRGARHRSARCEHASEWHISRACTHILTHSTLRRIFTKLNRCVSSRRGFISATPKQSELHGTPTTARWPGLEGGMARLHTSEIGGSLAILPNTHRQQPQPALDACRLSHTL